EGLHNPYIPGNFDPEEFMYGYTLQVPGSGSQRVLWPSESAGNYPAGTDLVTQNNWVLECAGTDLDDKDSSTSFTAHSIVATSPAGVKYYFKLLKRSYVGMFRKPADPKMFFREALYRLLPTKAVDRFGNEVTYTYDNNLNIQ